jgi:hypothetical protein
MARWTRGEQTVQFLIDRSRLESFEAEDLTALTDVLIVRTARRVETTAAAALAGGDVDGAYVAAYDAYRMAAEALLARQGLRAAGGDGSHMAVEDAVSAQFATDIPAFAKPTFERFRRTRHSAQYFGPFRSTDHRVGCFVGDREGDRRSVGSKGFAGSLTAGAVQLVM